MNKYDYKHACPNKCRYCECPTTSLRCLEFEYEILKENHAPNVFNPLQGDSILSDFKNFPFSEYDINLEPSCFVSEKEKDECETNKSSASYYVRCPLSTIGKYNDDHGIPKGQSKNDDGYKYLRSLENRSDISLKETTYTSDFA